MKLYRCMRPILFLGDPERVHHRVVRLAELFGNFKPARRFLSAVYERRDPRLECRIHGLRFPSPIGLAAGFDKNGRAIEAMSRLGFGHLEVGSVSAGPSEGNPRPRLFRLPKDEAIVVYYGVPNEGAPTVATRLRTYSHHVPLGVNLVETNTGNPATADEVIDQFLFAARELVGIADYLALNLACPNTSADKSVFNDPATLKALLGAYDEIPNLPPVFPKLAASTDPRWIGEVVGIVHEVRCVSGYIFNLPPGKDYSLKTAPEKWRHLPGTLAGPPTRALMNETIRAWYRRIDRERHAIIGSGGIFSAHDAYQKIRLGASALQLYTAMVYHGPDLVRRIQKELVRLLHHDGFDHIAQAVGVDADPTR